MVVVDKTNAGEATGIWGVHGACSCAMTIPVGVIWGTCYSHRVTGIVAAYLRETTRTPISRRRITLKILEGEGGSDCTD